MTADMNDKRYIFEDRGPDLPTKRVAVIRCTTCAAEIECRDSWANACETCDAEYDSNGNRLAPRSLWGEETGEQF